MEVLRLENVCKSLGKRKVLNNLSFSVKSGEILGFLGPNGAGKTTTIRLITTLMKPDSGYIYVNGYDVALAKKKALQGMGCIIENPDMYGYLSGRKNLVQYGRMYGNVSMERINEAVKLVGLADRIDDKVKNYSLGMKQRLGLAQAILAHPKLVILDEPTNGLDPIGMIELRDIIKKMALEENTAFLISSHSLGEIVQCCTSVCIINKGEIKGCMSVQGKDQSEMEKVFIDVVREG